MSEYKVPELPYPEWHTRFNRYTNAEWLAAHRQGWDEALAALRQQADETERLRVQLAGCAVAAMSNTRESLARAKEVRPGDYGWSASYGDCLAAAEREVELREKLEAGQAEPVAHVVDLNVSDTGRPILVAAFVAGAPELPAGTKLYTAPPRARVTREALAKAWISTGCNAADDMLRALRSLGLNVEVES